VKFIEPSENLAKTLFTLNVSLESKAEVLAALLRKCIAPSVLLNFIAADGFAFENDLSVPSLYQLSARIVLVA